MKQLNFDECMKAFAEVENNQSENVVLLSVKQERTDAGGNIHKYYVLACAEADVSLGNLRVLKYGKFGWELSDLSIEEMGAKKKTLMEAFMDNDYPEHAGDIYFFNEGEQELKEYETACECMQSMAEYQDPVVLTLSNSEFLEIFDLLRAGDYLLIFEEQRKF